MQARLFAPVLCLILLASPTPPAAAAPAATALRSPFAIPVERYQLPSGMTVLLHRDPSLPRVVVSLWFRVGSKDERPGRTGLAHLYEHLMFMGSKNLPNGAFDQLMEAEGGHNNASTSTDATYYYDTGPSNTLPLLLWLEAERLTTLPEAMTDEKVALQREVVRNERRQSYENRPYGAAELRRSDAMYPPGHPYSWPVIGSHADLLAASTQDVKQFFYQYYTASNAVLTVAGDINPEEARRLIEHFFGWMPKVPVPQRVAPPQPTAPVVTSLTLQDQVELPRVYLMWHAPPSADPAIIEAQLLVDVLGGGKSSRLHQALVFRRQLAQSVEVEIDDQLYGSLFIAEITARPGVTPQALLDATQQELERIVKEPVTQDELDRARNRRLTSWAREIETLLGRARRLSEMQVLYGDPTALQKQVDELRKITPQRLLARAQALRLAQAGARLALTVVPAAKGSAETGGAGQGAPPAAATPASGAGVQAAAQAGADQAAASAKAAALKAQEEALDLSKRPSLTQQPALKPTKVGRFRVGQLDVVLVQRKGSPLIAAEVVIPAGSAADAPQKAGLAGAVAAMLTEGAGERTAEQVAAALDQIGATLRAVPQQDSTQVLLEVMAERYRDAAPLLFDVVARPRFGEADWHRVQAERIAEVIRLRAEPRYVAERAYLASIYGADHPYGTPPQGTQDTLAGLRLPDLRAFHAARYQPRGAALIIAGDIELTQAQAQLLAAPFAGWTGTSKDGPPGKEVLPAPLPVAGRLLLVDRPGAPQTELRIGNLTQGRLAPDRAQAEVVNLLLGGTFTSRLNQDLRERHGWAYGAASQVLRLRDTGVFTARAAVRTDATADAVAEVLSELRRLRGEPVPAAELSKGRKSVVQRVVEQCERTSSLAQVYGDIFRYGLPVDELAQLVSGAQQSRPEALQRVARRLLLPDQPTVVLVGDRQKIEAPLRRLALPVTFEVRGEDGKPQSAAR